MTAKNNAMTANQQLKAQSIEAILKAAGECYLEHGLSGTTVDDIAARAGVGRATVFRNFKTKEAIFTEYVQRETNKVTTRLVEILKKAQSPEEYIKTLLIFIVCEGPKEPIYKISTADYHSKAYSYDLSFLYGEGDALLAETLSPFYKMAKKNGQLRQGVTMEVMMTWIKRLSISFVQDPMVDTDDPKKVDKYISTFVIPSLFRDNV